MTASKKQKRTGRAGTQRPTIPHGLDKYLENLHLQAGELANLLQLLDRADSNSHAANENGYALSLARRLAKALYEALDSSQVQTAADSSRGLSVQS